MKNQGGYLLVVAIFFVLVIGVMGSLIAHMFSARAPVSAAQYSGFSALYMAEAGLEVGTRLLSRPDIGSRISCANLTGTSQVTNASYGNGSITVATTGSAPLFASSALSSSATSSATSLTVSSASGFASSGRLIVDREIVSYAGIVGNTFTGVSRGMAGNAASSHSSGTIVSQYQCAIHSSSGISSVASPSYQRDVQWAVQLQDGWIVARRQGDNMQYLNWNLLSELGWTLNTLTGNNQSRAQLYGISMLSNADGWAVGQEADNNFTITHWNGNAWSFNNLSGACNGQDLYAVSMVSKNEGWAVGKRDKPGCGGAGNQRYTILRWDGNNWNVLTPTTSPTIPADDNSNQHLNAVHVIDTNGNGVGNLGFAVGNNGTILQYNGSAWVTNATSTTKDLYAVCTVSVSEAWAVGQSGTILKWNGSAWSEFSSPDNQRLNGLAMIDLNGNGQADTGWAVGNGGATYYYNGSGWTSIDSGVNKQLLAVGVFSANDAWAAGNDGKLLHWDGSAWAEVESGISQDLTAISLVRTGNSPVSAWQEIFR